MMMSERTRAFISVVIPVFNEEAGLAAFHVSLEKILKGLHNTSYEILYCDDGSIDGTVALIRRWCQRDKTIKLLKLSRNFGKEIALTAGIHAAKGQAIITLDADGQHPVELIPRFIEQWQSGCNVVIGVCIENKKAGLVKRAGSKAFYWLFNHASNFKLLPGATDFRLIDRTVQRDFAGITERNRITRGLIDWLGYERSYIEFKANPRLAGEATYSFRRLVKLALNSMISLSVSPLYISAYIGAIILPLSVLLGLFMLVNLLIGDPLLLHISGSGYVMVLLLFLVGILLTSQAIIGLYLSQIHAETQNRPLYVIDRKRSVGLGHDS